MQFTEDRAIQVIEELKRQTRRPEHYGDAGYFGNAGKRPNGDPCFDYVLDDNDRLRYEVGKTYAVQPGRGKPGLQWVTLDTNAGPINHVLTREDLAYPDVYGVMVDGPKEARIKIFEIWREDVRNISLQDAIAEGFKDREGFWQAWIMMYDRVLRRPLVRYGSIVDIKSEMATRPINLYMAWALRFELVK